MPGIKEFLDTLSPEALIERLRLALDGSQLGIWDWDLRDNSVQFDRRWCEMLGLDHATTPMQLDTWSARVHPDDLAGCYADVNAHIEGRTPAYQNIHRMKHARGHWLYILDRGRISGRDAAGKPIRFTGTHTDVTATEEARVLVEGHERQLLDFVSNLPAGVAMLDLQLRYLGASRAWKTLHHLEGELTGRAFGEGNARGEELWGQSLERALRGEASRGEETLVSREGEAPRYSRWDTRPWLKHDGSIGGALISVEDVTERVLRREEAERARTAQLSTLALFSGGIAHEINTPLQVILNEAEVARRLLEDEPLDRANLVESVTAIDATAKRAAAITRALRTLSRDARSDPAGEVPLGPLLADAMALTRSRFSSAGVTLTLENRVGDVRLLGRPSELLHVLLNVLNNAYDATQGSARATIQLEVERVGSSVVLRCVDSGPGVAPEHLGRLMTPFFTTKPQGTGIGLSLSRALIERNGGFLRHVSTAPKTTFEVGVPVASSASL